MEPIPSEPHSRSSGFVEHPGISFHLLRLTTSFHKFVESSNALLFPNSFSFVQGNYLETVAEFHSNIISNLAFAIFRVWPRLI